MQRVLVTALGLGLVVGCFDRRPESKPPTAATPVTAPAAAAAAPAVDPKCVVELRAGQFGAAEGAAIEALAADPSDSTAAAVRALTRYLRVTSELVDDFGQIIEEADDHGHFDHAGMRDSYQRTLDAFADIDRDLATAAASPDFALELCLACWKRDWNHNNRIDDGDRLLFQLEQDAAGDELPEGDPRRKPTFRFDQGDLLWARAMLSFQRAALELVVAYRWDELDQLLFDRGGAAPPRITIRLGDPQRVVQARTLILAGLGYADQARRLYLAETDDDREWVPNPRQQNHPLPLPVDEGLYATWDGVLGDVRRLIAGDEGLSLREAMLLLSDDWPSLPTGFIDVGALLSRPRDVVFDFAVLERVGNKPTAANIDAALHSLIGDAYAPSMKPSPLIGRFARMKRDLERGDDTLGRKLRYLLWLN